MAIIYHGTNRLFDKFDLSKILTGEGNNIHGEGFYFAFDKNISKEYAKAISKRYLVSPNGEMFDLSYGLNIFTIDECVACVIKTLNDAKVNGEEYDEKDVIRDIIDFNCFCLKKSFIRQNRIKEVTSRYNQVKNWERNSGFLYSVEIDDKFIRKNNLSTKLYHGQRDGLCLVVKDTSIIKIVNVEEIPYSD